MDQRLEQQLAFLIEADKMKQILRQTVLMDKSRQENDAEHSWHLALSALVLYEYADRDQVNLNRVLRMALVHDLIEIYAGDTFAYDDAENESKSLRELAAADRLFSLLPPEQGDEIRALWEEFEAMETPDAKFTNAIDRFQPLLHNHMTDGHTWRLGNVTLSKVYRRMEPVRHAAPVLWETVECMIRNGVEKGHIQKD